MYRGVGVLGKQSLDGEPTVFPLYDEIGFIEYPSKRIMEGVPVPVCEQQAY